MTNEFVQDNPALSLKLSKRCTFKSLGRFYRTKGIFS